MPLFLVLAFGCGKKNPNAAASVSGTVKYKGTALPGGTLAFNQSGKTGSYTANIAPDGTYGVADIPSGDMVVTVETESVKPKQAKGAMAAKMSKMMSPIPDSVKAAPPPKGEYVKIPLKYSDPKSSPLKVTLKDGKNDNTNFDLTD